MFGQGGEDLAVEEDLLLECRADELRVRKSERLQSCADLVLPHAAEVVLLVLAVHELVDSGLSDGDLRLLLLGGAAEAVALGCTEHLAAVLIGRGSSFDARHRRCE